MSSEQASPARKTGIRIWIEAGALWAVLLALFGINASLAFVQIGTFGVVLHLLIALVMIGLLVVFFMDFREYTPLLRLAAVAGVFWLIFMFVLTAGDYFTRF
jgi:cytochrome c oxidase subunit IV